MSSTFMALNHGKRQKKARRKYGIVTLATHEAPEIKFPSLLCIPSALQESGPVLKLKAHSGILKCTKKGRWRDAAEVRAF